MKRRTLSIVLFAIVILTLALMSFFMDSSMGKENVEFGILSLLPPLIAILLAFLTKQVLLSLFIGILVGTTMLHGNIFFGFLRTIDEIIVGSLADTWNAAIIIFTLSIGGMVGVVGKMGGTKAIADKLSKLAKTARSAQVVTAIMGILVFFDDYANTLIVGPTMRPLSDRLRVSREKLAYIVDSTAAPVVGMAAISTWVGTELGFIKKTFDTLSIDANVFSVFIKSIPYAFYNIFALVLVFTIALTLRDFGPMYKAEKRARKYGKLLDDNAKPMASDEVTKMELKEGTKLRARNAIVPILTLIIVAFFGLWYNGYTALSSTGIDPFTLKGMRECFGSADSSIVLIWGAIVSSIVAIVMGLWQKILTLDEAFDSWVSGAKSLVITCMILVLAWSLGGVTGSVGTADYLVQVVRDTIPGGFIPVIVFLLSCLMAFATGTSWGTMGIVIPLALPLANSYITGDPTQSTIMLATISAVLSGSIFGDHCSPISDTTIMSSMASASDHLDHVKTQIPYAITGGTLAIVAYLIVGFLDAGMIVTPLISLIIGIAVIISLVFILGKKTDKNTLGVQKKETI